MQANQQFVAEMSPLSPLLQNVLLQTSKGESSDFNAFSGNQGKVPVVLQHISNDEKENCQKQGSIATPRKNLDFNTHGPIEHKETSPEALAVENQVVDG